MTVLFGYRFVDGLACGVCGVSYLCFEHVNGRDVLRCWCGASCPVTFDDEDERAAFIERHGG